MSATTRIGAKCVRGLLMAGWLVCAFTWTACIPPEEGGIGGTGHSDGSYGPIEKFGSIFVNGVEWEIGDADIEIDGATADEAELGLGQVVAVLGERDADGELAVAGVVVAEDEVVGPIAKRTAVDVDVVDLEVMDLVVRVERGVTHHAGPGFDFDALAEGRVIAVSGLDDQIGGVLATRLRDRGDLEYGATEVQLEGPVVALRGDDSFMLRSVRVEFDDATVFDGIDEADLANGVRVRVTGTLLDDRLVRATRIARERRIFEGSYASLEVDGIVGRFKGLGDFKVGGQPVDASAAEFVNGAPDLLRNGVRVEVEGALVEGLLVAERVEIEAKRNDRVLEADFGVAGDLVFTGERGEMLLFGIDVATTSATHFVDARDGVADFDLHAIAPGDRIHVAGIANGRGGLIARRVTRFPPSAGVFVAAPIDALDPANGTFDLLGLEVRIDADSLIESGLMTWCEFFAQVVAGDRVNVLGDALSWGDRLYGAEVELDD